MTTATATKPLVRWGITPTTCIYTSPSDPAMRCTREGVHVEAVDVSETVAESLRPAIRYDRWCTVHLSVEGRPRA